MLLPSCATLLTGGSTVKIETTPPGAAVSVNSIPAGTSPLSTDLYPGDRVKLELDNHKTRVLILGREKTTIKPIFFLNHLSIVVGILLLVTSDPDPSRENLSPFFAALIGGMAIGGGIVGTSVDFSSGRGVKVRKDPISVVLEESGSGPPN